MADGRPGRGGPAAGRPTACRQAVRGFIVWSLPGDQRRPV